MLRQFIFLLPMLALLTACSTGNESPRLGADGKPLPKVYPIKPADESTIQYRMLDSINSLRQAAGAGPVQFDATLNAAAATHSRDMSVQNRPWHFGSDGSSPIDRVKRTGFTGYLIGENISETYETELETLAVWMDEDGSRAVILDPKATALGFAWFQEPSGKIWWTMVMGG